MAALKVKLTGKKSAASSQQDGVTGSSTAASTATSTPAAPRIKLLSSASAATTPSSNSGSPRIVLTGSKKTAAEKTTTAKSKAARASLANQSTPAKTEPSTPSISLSLKGKKRTHDEATGGEAMPTEASTPSHAAGTPAQDSEPRRKIKLSFNAAKLREKTEETPPSETPGAKAAASSVATPTPTLKLRSGAGTPKIQLKSLKVGAAKANGTVAKQGKPRPLPNLKIKHLGKPPVRPPGEGYDSEDDEAEVDPAIESQIVLRMLPGEDCDYLQQAIAERRIGHPDPRQRAKVNMKFFDRDCRRALLNVRGNLYAAALVDLPCIIESHKSWDRKNIYKSADICQMLLVIGKIEGEEQAKSYPLPRDVDPSTWAYQNGITPPMYKVRGRRFRKRVSYHTIEEIESTVDQLLEADRKAKDSGGTSEYRIVDDAVADESEEIEEESEMEVDPESFFGSGDDGNGFDEDALAEATALMEDDDDITQPTILDERSSQMVDNTIDISDLAAIGAKLEESDDEEEDEDEDEDEGELDEEALARQNELLELKEQIDEIHTDLRTKRAQLQTQENRLLRNRLQSAIERLVQDLDVRKKEYLAKGGRLDEDEDED